MSRPRELALTGFLLCACAAVLGVPALYVPGIAALLATLLARLWVSSSAARLELSLNCAEQSAQEGDRVAVSVQVRRGLLPFPGGTLEPWPGTDEVALPLGRELVLAGAAALERRGRQRIGPARVLLSDPFDLCTRVCEVAGSELLVLPRVESLDPAALDFLDGAGGSSREPPQALDSLQAHRPGSPASRIHWPTVARSGVLMERSMRTEDDPRVLLELDASRPESELALDMAVRATASLCLHIARRGGCMIALPDEPRPTFVGTDLQAWPAVHARLALIAPLTANRRGVAHRGMSLIRVSASRAPASAELGTYCRVAPHPLPGAATLFEISGCAVQYFDRHRMHSAA